MSALHFMHMSVTAAAVVQLDEESGGVMADRPFLADPMLLVSSPAGVQYALLARVWDGSLVCQPLKGPASVRVLQDVLLWLRDRAAAAVQLPKLVCAHSLSMFRRPITWRELVEGGSKFDSLWGDMVEIINFPAVLDLAERRSWSLGRMWDVGLLTTPAHTVAKSGARIVDASLAAESMFVVSDMFMNPYKYKNQTIRS